MVTMRILAVLTLIAIGAGCGPGDRPTVADWRPGWDAVQNLIPPASELERPPPEEECQRVLGLLRNHRGELTPSPDPIIEAAVDAWFAYAEHVFFSCFDAVPSDDPVDGAYETLDRLRREVEAAIASAASADG